MRVPSWLRPLAARLTRTATPQVLRRPAFRPRLEALEDRAVPAGIGGHVFIDSNGDRAMQAGEPGQAGLAVYIDANRNGRLDGGEPTATTDDQGAYSFTGLAAGTYVVRGPALRPGWVGTTPVSYTVTLGSGQDVTGKDFGTFQRGSLSGHVFIDTDGDGGRDPGERALAGITVYLDSNHNGRLDGFEPRVVTGPTGAYTFANLGPGTYFVREVLPAVWLQTVPAGGSVAVALTSGGVSGHDLGNFLRGSLSGRTVTAFGAALRRVVFLDANGNGTRDPGERWVVTDVYGRYAFTGLGPGTYTVREVVPAGWHLVSPPGGAFSVLVTSGKRAGGLNFLNSVGSYPGLAGAWNQGGLPTQIQEDGNSLLFTNESGDSSAGYFISATQVVATGWNVVGALSGSPGHYVISWSNGTTWQEG